MLVTLINSYLDLSMQKYTSGNTSHHSSRSLQVSPAFSVGKFDQCTKSLITNSATDFRLLWTRLQAEL